MSLLKDYLDIDKDVAPFQKKNKVKLLELAKLSTLAKSLIKDRAKYFEEGNVCEFTPEELDKKIIKKLEEEDT